jgi:hypothetical protein
MDAVEFNKCVIFYLNIAGSQSNLLLLNLTVITIKAENDVKP